MPQVHVTRAVLAAVRRLPNYPRLSVLDLSCGQGEILAELAADGCEVRGTHFKEGDYILRGQAPRIDVRRIDAGVDLTRPLPYADAAFDVVLSTEVIEHLGTFVPILSETGRVLASGGHLVLTTPNVHRLHSRWQFLWTGTHKLIDRGPGWDLKPSELYRIHSNPADFPLLHTLLFQNGLGLTRLDISRFKKKHALWCLAWPLVWLATRLRFRARKGCEQRRRGERDLRRWMSSVALCFSEQIVLTAQRRDVAHDVVLHPERANVSERERAQQARSIHESPAAAPGTP